MCFSSSIVFAIGEEIYVNRDTLFRELFDYTLYDLRPKISRISMEQNHNYAISETLCDSLISRLFCYKHIETRVKRTRITFPLFDT